MFYERKNSLNNVNDAPVLILCKNIYQKKARESHELFNNSYKIAEKIHRVNFTRRKSIKKEKETERILSFETFPDFI